MPSCEVSQVNGEQRRKRRALVIFGVVLCCLLVLEITTGCGRKKPPRPLHPDARLIQYRVV